MWEGCLDYPTVCLLDALGDVFGWVGVVWGGWVCVCLWWYGWGEGGARVVVVVVVVVLVHYLVCGFYFGREGHVRVFGWVYVCVSIKEGG